MLTIIAMAAVATVVYATVATAVRWIERPDRAPAQRIGSWAVLALILVGIAVLIVNAEKDVVVGFCIGALIAPAVSTLRSSRGNSTPQG